MRVQKSFGAAVFLLALLVAGPLAAAEKITVFAAASLTDALNAIDATYTAKTGTAVTVSFASSSTLAKQIEAGAPAQIFLSADTKWMDYLDKKNLIEPGTRHDVLGNKLAPGGEQRGAAGIRLGAGKPFGRRIAEAGGDDDLPGTRPPASGVLPEGAGHLEDLRRLGRTCHNILRWSD